MREGPVEMAINTAAVQQMLGVSTSGRYSLRPTPLVEEGPVVAVTVPVTGGVGFVLSGTGFFLSVVCGIWYMVFGFYESLPPSS